MITLFLFTRVADDPVVTTSLGKIKGQSIGSRSEKMDRFLSIPYAEKPVGDLRLVKHFKQKPNLIQTNRLRETLQLEGSKLLFPKKAGRLKFTTLLLTWTRESE